MLPAIGQGALAIEARGDDARVRELCASLVDPDSEAAVAAERAILARLNAWGAGGPERPSGRASDPPEPIAGGHEDPVRVPVITVGCRTPIAGYAEVRGGRLQVRGLVGRPDASEILREQAEGPVAAAVALGTEVGERLLARGAHRILADLEGRP